MNKYIVYSKRTLGFVNNHVSGNIIIINQNESQLFKMYIAVLLEPDHHKYIQSNDEIIPKHWEQIKSHYYTLAKLMFIQ